MTDVDYADGASAQHCDSRSRTDSRPNDSWLRLGHLRVGDDVIDQQCIALDLLVQFKLKSSIRDWTHV